LKPAIKIAEELRAGGWKADIDLENRKLKKNLEYVDALKIPFVAIVGEDELKQNKVMWRDMLGGEQKLLTVAEIKKLK
jgi:histidyl-tRNA synthetase